MTRRLNLDQWTVREELPAIIWTYTGVFELEPVAVNDSHENDLYDEYAAAFFAAHAYQTAEEVEDYYDNYSLSEIWRAYGKGDGTAERMGLPREWYVEGAAEDGSDAIIYVDESTEYESRREDWQTAVHYLDPADVNEVWQIVAAARRS